MDAAGLAAAAAAAGRSTSFPLASNARRKGTKSIPIMNGCSTGGILRGGRARGGAGRGWVHTLMRRVLHGNIPAAGLAAHAAAGPAERPDVRPST